MRIAIVLAVLTCSTIARAQEPAAEPKFSVSVSGTIWLPEGDSDDTSDTSLGVRPQFAYWIKPFVGLLASFDYVFVNEKDVVNDSITYYVISLGARFTTPKPAKIKPYGEFLLGRHKLDGGGADDSGIGFRIGGGGTFAISDTLLATAGLAYSSVSIGVDSVFGEVDLDIDAFVFELGLVARF